LNGLEDAGWIERVEDYEGEERVDPEEDLRGWKK